MQVHEKSYAGGVPNKRTASSQMLAEIIALAPTGAWPMKQRPHRRSGDYEAASISGTVPLFFT